MNFSTPVSLACGRQQREIRTSKQAIKFFVCMNAVSKHTTEFHALKHSIFLWGLQTGFINREITRNTQSEVYIKAGISELRFSDSMIAEN